MRVEFETAIPLRRLIMLKSRYCVGVMVDYSTQNGPGKATKNEPKNLFNYLLSISYGIYKEFTLDLFSKRLDIPSHIPCDSSRERQSALANRSRVVFLQTVLEEFEPALVVSLAERLAPVELAMQAHHVSLIVTIAEQHLSPVGLDMGQVHGNIDLRSVQEHRSQQGIYQHPCVETIDKFIDVYGAVQIGCVRFGRVGVGKKHVQRIRSAFSAACSSWLILRAPSCDVCD